LKYFGDGTMEVRNCRKCNKIFEYYTGYPLCPECKIQDEITYMRVREYIKVNPGVTIDKASNELGVSRQLLIRYLREEKLEVYEKSNVVLVCEICGHGITTGRFCDDCKEKIESGRIKQQNQAASNLQYFNEDEDNKIRYFKQRD
jgi:tagatose-1,6-bisphosphate aldolase